MYSGTLGLKHNPRQLLELARGFRDAAVVVISEGMGADWLEEHRLSEAVTNLRVLGYQEYDHYADVLATGDVLLAVLEPEAGVFSVPSKVLSYHAAGRPILAAIPRTNLAARIIDRAGSGFVAEPGDFPAFNAYAGTLVADADKRESMGRAARLYAEKSFDITEIGNQFEDLCVRTVKSR